MRKLKKFFKWLVPEALKGGIQYYSTKRGMIVGGKKAGQEVNKQISLGFKKKF